MSVKRILCNIITASFVVYVFAGFIICKCLGLLQIRILLMCFFIPICILVPFGSIGMFIILKLAGVLHISWLFIIPLLIGEAVTFITVYLKR